MDPILAPPGLIRTEPLIDPHFWTDPLRAQRAVDVIVEALSSLDPRAGLLPGARRCGPEADRGPARGDRAGRGDLDPAAGGDLPRLAVLLRREVRPAGGGVVQTVPGTEPTAQHMAALVPSCAGAGAALFTEPQMESQLAQALARSGGGGPRGDALGGGPRAASYESSCGGSRGRWTGRCDERRPPRARGHRRDRRPAHPRRRELRGRAGRVRLPVRPNAAARRRSSRPRWASCRSPRARSRCSGASGSVRERGRLPAAGEDLQPRLPRPGGGRDRGQPARGVAAAGLSRRPGGGEGRPRAGRRRAPPRRAPARALGRGAAARLPRAGPGERAGPPPARRAHRRGGRARAHGSSWTPGRRGRAADLAAVLVTHNAAAVRRLARRAVYLDGRFGRGDHPPRCSTASGTGPPSTATTTRPGEPPVRDE